jgi:hypothetical protein
MIPPIIAWMGGPTFSLGVLDFQLGNDVQTCAQPHRHAPAKLGGSSYATGYLPTVEHMLLIIGLLIMLTAVVFIPRVWVRGGVSAATLGWMSEQWLAEYRASHLS